jgi:hypothetical protein
MPDDPRLSRLLEYTKFHIGIYLSAFGAIAAAIAAAAAKPGELQSLLNLVFVQRWALVPAAFFLALAGFAGGIIASCCTQNKTFDDLWNGLQGPGSCEWLAGRVWAQVEHVSFWLSLGFMAVALLWSRRVLEWLCQ